MSELLPINIEQLDRDQALQYVKRFQVLLEINANINSTMDLEMLLRTIIDVATTVADAEASSLALRDAGTGELVFHLASGESGKTVESLRLPKGQGIAGWVAENGESVIVPDVSQDKRFFKGVDEKSAFVTRSILCVPMRRSGDKIIGVLQVLNKRKGTFDDQDMVLFTSLANIAAIAIENSQLYHILQQTMNKLKEDNTRLNNILGQLKQSEEEVKRMKTQMLEKDGAVVGSLSVFIPPNILQMLANDMKTGTIHLKTPTAQGKIYLRKGEVYHAELLQDPKLTGNDATYEMINWNEGSFSFKDTEHSDQNTIQGSCMHLIIEGLRRGDELKVLQEKFSPAKIPSATGAAYAEEVPPQSQQVLDLIQTEPMALEAHWRHSKLDQHSFYSAVQFLADAHLISF
ncbi:MAG: GAF domain-containing protein [Candidatus Sericytochromatia bacterium]|nr:GAF domain-containing protein [Candidatus Sericytochromatia bacterium]